MNGIEIGFPFDVRSANPIDVRLLLTKAQMLAMNDNMMPENYLALCKDDGKLYLYDKDATPSAETGKFTEFAGGEGTSTRELTQAEYDALTEAEKMNGTIYFITDGQGGGGGGSYVLPPATASTLGGVKVGSGLSVESDGTLSATSGTGNADFEIDKDNNYVRVTSSGQSLTLDFNNADTLPVTAADPGTYFGSRTLATKDYVDANVKTYTAGPNIAIDNNNVISANGVFIQKEGTTLWEGRIYNGTTDITISTGNWSDYDAIEFWGHWGQNAIQEDEYQGSPNLLGTLDVKDMLVTDKAYVVQYVAAVKDGDYNEYWSVKRTGDKTATIKGENNGSRRITKIIGIKYNTGPIIGGVNLNGSPLSVINNTVDIDTPRAYGDFVEGEIYGMRLYVDGGKSSNIHFTNNADGVNVQMTDENDTRVDKTLVTKDVAQTLTSPTGTKYKLKVADDGTLSTEVVV